MTQDERTADLVAKRLEGNKKFTYLARETVYYQVEIFAKDREEADQQYYSMDLSDHISDSDNFETNEVYEEEIEL